MHVSANLDIDLLALGREEEVTCLLRLAAPVPPAASDRPGQGLVVVLDRSGSMGGAPLDGATAAIADLVRRLAPQDAFGLVVFDTQAAVVAPVRRMLDHHLEDLVAAVRSVRAGGSTDLSSGYVLGLREARSAADLGVVATTVLVVSDGHANAGIVDPTVLSGLATNARDEARITTSTLGWGTAYDAVLLTAVTAAGQGDHRFAADVDEGMHALAQATGELLAKSVLGATVRIGPRTGLVDRVTLRRDLPHRVDGSALVVPLGDLYGGEERSVLVRLHVPALDSLGTATVADVRIEYTAMPALTEHTVTLPIAVNVVPGDEARGRVPDPLVEVESLLSDIDDVKRKAAEGLRARRSVEVKEALEQASLTIGRWRASAAERLDPASSARLDEAQVDLRSLQREVEWESTVRAEKSLMDSLYNTSRGRKARPRHTQPPDSPTDASTPVDPDADADEAPE
jgi:Ca-activated chloride channel homolog